MSVAMQPRPLKTTISALRDEAGCQQMRVQSEIKVQLLTTILQMVKNLEWTLRGLSRLSSLNSTHTVGNVIRQKVSS